MASVGPGPVGLEGSFMEGLAAVQGRQTAEPRRKDTLAGKNIVLDPSMAVPSALQQDLHIHL